MPKEHLHILINYTVKTGHCQVILQERSHPKEEKATEKPLWLIGGCDLLFSKKNADQSVASLIDDALQCFGKLFARFIRHVVKLCMKPFIDQLIK